MRKILSVFAVVFMSFGLTGCFKSEKALITADNADFPFSTITYAENNSKATNTLVRVGDKYEDSKKRDEAFVRFKLVKENLYVIQISENRNDVTIHLYALIKLSPDGKSFQVLKGVAEKKDIAAVIKGQSGLSICDKGLICLSSLQAYIKYAGKAVNADVDATYTILSVKKP